MLVAELSLDALWVSDPSWWKFRVLLVILFVYPENKQQMEDASYILAPMQKQLVEHFIDNQLLEVILELFCKYVVKFVNNGQDLL